jgi:hypothetical protein
MATVFPAKASAPEGDTVVQKLPNDLELARELIQRKEYAAARRVLLPLSVTNETAQQWLKRLDQIDPPPRNGSANGAMGAISLIAVGLAFLLSIIAVIQWTSRPQNMPLAAVLAVAAFALLLVGYVMRRSRKR